MDLSRYLETMKNLPDRFSNLAFWRGVRKLRDAMVKTFEYVGEWGTLVENNLTSIESRLTQLGNNINSIGNMAGTTVSRLNRSFESRDLTMTSNVSPHIYACPVPERKVPYPRVDQCILTFTSNNTLGISTSEIIESAYFTGSFVLEGNTISFTQPVLLIPLYNQPNIQFMSPPIPLYRSGDSASMSNFNFTIKVRCRKIPS